APPDEPRLGRTGAVAAGNPLTLERAPRFTLGAWPSPSPPSPTRPASAPTPSATTNGSACSRHRPGPRPATACTTRTRSPACGDQRGPAGRAAAAGGERER